MLDEVTKDVEVLEQQLNIKSALELAKDTSKSGDGYEEPLQCFFKIGSSAISLRARPDLTAPVIAEARAGQTLSARAHRGLWLNVSHGEGEGWILCFRGKRSVGTMVRWDVATPAIDMPLCVAHQNIAFLHQKV